MKIFLPILVTVLLALGLSACGGGNSGSETGTTNHTIGGTVSGLTGSVILKNNGGNGLTVSTDGNFTFAANFASGSTYSVTVSTQPTNQTCTVISGSGTISNNVTNVSVSCSNNSYTVGGGTTGLTGSVVLQDNGGDNLTVAANGTFTFATPIASGSPYSVVVLTQPTGQTCSVSTGAGTVSANNVSNVAVVCSINTFNVGGGVTGLTGSIVLQDNGGDNLSVAANSTFTFATPIASGSPYSVTVLTQPISQNCSVASSTGTIAIADVTNVAITCAVNTYTISGKVTGLNGSMVLQDNGGDNLTVSVNGNFTFSTTVAYGNPYSVYILTQPTSQTCTVTGNSGTATANIANVAADCVNNPTPFGTKQMGVVG